jgi:hypothetical protein
MSFQFVQKGAVTDKTANSYADSETTRAIVRLAGYTAIGGAVTMIIGAALWGSSGTDLWVALANDEMAAYLTAATAAKPAMVANTTFWILGVLLLGVAGTTLARLCGRRPVWAQVAQVCFNTAVPLAIVSFLAMVVLVVQIGADSSETAVALAKVVGWIGTKADDIATILIIGAGPLFISMAGRRDWLPIWLARWGYLAGLTGLIAAVIIYFPALSTVGLIIVPVGMGWMIAVGVVLLRHMKKGA